MKYNIVMPRDQFTQSVNLVKAIRRGNYKLPELRLVTQGTEYLSDDKRKYLDEDPAALGVTFGDHERGLFDVWLSPNITDWSTDFAIDTVLHELCHGFFSCYKHGEQFRRYLGRVIFHFGCFVRPVDTNKLVTNMVARYSRDTVEHQNMEIESIYQAHLREFAYVSRKYEELQNAENLVMHVA